MRLYFYTVTMSGHKYLTIDTEAKRWTTKPYCMGDAVKVVYPDYHNLIERCRRAGYTV